jgi:hypothetical protein
MEALQVLVEEGNKAKNKTCSRSAPTVRHRQRQRRRPSSPAAPRSRPPPPRRRAPTPHPHSSTPPPCAVDPVGGWPETPPPPPPGSRPVDPLDDFVVPATPESAWFQPSYADIVRRPPPTSSLCTPPASPPPGHPPQRHLISAAIIPLGSSYYAARHPPLTPRREIEVTGAQHAIYGQDACAKRIWRPRQPTPVRAAATMLEPGWTPAKRRRRSSCRAPPAAPRRDGRLGRRSSVQSGRPASAALQAFVKATADRCFNCLASYHWAAHCRDPVCCLRCRRSGHRARFCREVRPVAAPRRAPPPPPPLCRPPPPPLGHHLCHLPRHRQTGLAAATLHAMGVLLTTARRRGEITTVAATAL